MRKLTMKEFIAEGKKLFGPNRLKWRFICPVCGFVAKAEDWIKAGAPEGAIGFSCIGRWLREKRRVRNAFGETGPGPCNYSGGGFFHMNPIIVGKFSFFEFAPKEEEKNAG